MQNYKKESIFSTIENSGFSLLGDFSKQHGNRHRTEHKVHIGVSPTTHAQQYTVAVLQRTSYNQGKTTIGYVHRFVCGSVCCIRPVVFFF